MSNEKKPGWVADKYNLDTEEEKAQFTRGIFLAQIWGHVIDVDPADFLENVLEHEELEAEYDKAANGEPHEFGKAVADHYGLPVKEYGDRVTLDRKHQRRYQEALVKSGIAPSLAERALNFMTMGVLGRNE